MTNQAIVDRRHGAGSATARSTPQTNQRFGLASFTDLTSEQVSELVDRLVELRVRRARAQGSDQGTHV